MNTFYDGLTPYLDTVDLIFEEMKHKHSNIIAKSSPKDVIWLEDYILDISTSISSLYEKNESIDEKYIIYLSEEI